MRRLLAVTLGGLCLGMNIAGCGSNTGADAIVETVSVPPALVSGDTGATFGAAGGQIFPNGVNPPVIFRVIKSSLDIGPPSTPVPDADIDIDITGSNVIGEIFLDPALTKPAGNGLHFHTRTDNEGEVAVYPAWVFLACGAAIAPINGTGTVGATISTSQSEYIVQTTLNCP